MPGAVEFLASYFVGKQLGTQQNVDASIANRLGVTQAMLGLTPMSVILVNEIAKREAQSDGVTTNGSGDNPLTVPLSAFGAPSTKGTGKGTASGTTTASGAPRASTEREVPIGARPEEHADPGVAPPPGAGPRSPSQEHPTLSGD